MGERQGSRPASMIQYRAGLRDCNARTLHGRIEYDNCAIVDIALRRRGKLVQSAVILRKVNLNYSLLHYHPANGPQ